MTKEWAEVIGAAAWPITVLIVFLIYKNELKSLLKEVADFIKELAVFKAGEITVERRTQQVLARALEAEGNKAEPNISHNQTEEVMANQTKSELTEARAEPNHVVHTSHKSITPEAAILESWAKFERATKNELIGKGVSVSEKKDWVTLLSDFVPSDIYTVIREQRKVRNVVAHGGEATPSAAENFEHVTEVLLRVIRVSFATAKK